MENLGMPEEQKFPVEIFGVTLPIIDGKIYVAQSTLEEYREKSGGLISRIDASSLDCERNRRQDRVLDQTLRDLSRKLYSSEVQVFSEEDLEKVKRLGFGIGYMDQRDEEFHLFLTELPAGRRKRLSEELEKNFKSIENISNPQQLDPISRLALLELHYQALTYGPGILEGHARVVDNHVNKLIFSGKLLREDFLQGIRYLQGNLTGASMYLQKNSPKEDGKKLKF